MQYYHIQRPTPIPTLWYFQVVVTINRDNGKFDGNNGSMSLTFYSASISPAVSPVNLMIVLIGVLSAFIIRAISNFSSKRPF